MDCEGNFDLFCYVCGKLRLTKKKLWNEKAKQTYKKCFNREDVGEEPFAPSDICRSCYKFLLKFDDSVENQALPFESPMQWLADEHQNEDCYACANKKAKLYSSRTMITFEYKTVPSVRMPTALNEVMSEPPTDAESEMSIEVEQELDFDHDMVADEEPAYHFDRDMTQNAEAALGFDQDMAANVEPAPHTDLDMTNVEPATDIDLNSEVQPQSSVESSSVAQQSSAGWQPTSGWPPKASTSVDRTPKPLSQQELDTFVAKGRFSKQQSEFAARFLKKRNLILPKVKVTAYRRRHMPYTSCFTVNGANTFVYCHDVLALMKTMNMKYNTMDWNLFIDASSASLKAVLIHRLADKPSIPIAYSTAMKETYDDLDTILKAIKYDEHYWRISCDFKVMAILCGLKGGYAKHMCYKCLWDSRFNSSDQYQKKDWPIRVAKVGEHSVIREPLVPFEKLLLPPLHIKLGLVKNFIKQIVKREPVFLCLESIFPKISRAKLLQGMMCL